MKSEVIDTLLQINERFYVDQAQQFSNTRASAWKGWERCAVYVKTTAGKHLSTEQELPDACKCLVAERKKTACRILDVACGNLRFEAFLQQELLEVPLSFTAIDNCVLLSEDFAHEGVFLDASNVSFQQMDIVCALRTVAARGEESANSEIIFGEKDQFDMAVAFGFMHHIPTEQLRRCLLKAMVASVRPGGYVAVSFWEFMNNPGMAEKALRVHDQALRDMGLQSDDLEANDYIIGWNGQPGAYRYCHSFTSAEIDALLQSVAGCVRIVDRFVTDGRSNNLNEYVVLQVLDI